MSMPKSATALLIRRIYISLWEISPALYLSNSSSLVTRPLWKRAFSSIPGHGPQTAWKAWSHGSLLIYKVSSRSKTAAFIMLLCSSDPSDSRFSASRWGSIVFWCSLRPQRLPVFGPSLGVYRLLVLSPTPATPGFRPLAGGLSSSDALSDPSDSRFSATRWGSIVF